MHEPQQSEALPLLKGLRIVRQEEVIPETTYPAHTYIRQKVFGPCLVCGEETEYGEIWRYGTPEEHMKAWYAKQFETSRRRVHISVLNGTRKEGHLRVSTLEGLICETCRKSCKEVRDANEKERWAGIEAKQRAEDEWEKENERERERWDYHTTWRKASRGEFDEIPDGIANFTATTRAGRSYRILFRWRPVGGDCLGDSPRNVVGMWVDGTLVSHYYGWNFAPLGDTSPYPDGSEDKGIWERQDVFGLGFCAWLNRDFEEELRVLKPAAVWRSRGGHWPLTRDLSDLETPCVIYTKLPDGRTYARLLADNELPKVTAFAKKFLGLKLERTERTWKAKRDRMRLV